MKTAPRTPQPGEWQALADHAGRPWIQGPPDAEGFRTVASFPTDAPPYKPNTAQQHHDAALISAAPDLLAALHRVTARLEYATRHEPYTTATAEALDTARAALARATNEQPAHTARARLQVISRQATPEPTDSAQTLADRLAECARLADDPTAGDFYTRLAAIHKTATGAAHAPLDPLDNDQTAHAAGLELAAVLGLKTSRAHPDRYNLPNGSVTAAGLARLTARRLP